MCREERKIDKLEREGERKSVDFMSECERDFKSINLYKVIGTPTASRRLERIPEMLVNIVPKYWRTKINDGQSAQFVRVGG